MAASARVLLNRLLAKARFRHLQVLVRLAELGSVKRAAESIGLTQPAVTQLLADLERLLGVALFHRHSRGVLPTAACRDLLPLARQSLAGLHATAEALAERAQIGQGVVRVWSSTAALNGLLVEAIPEFNRRHPGVQVHLKEAELAEQFLAIGRRELDIGFCRAGQVVPEGWRFVPLLDDEFVVACAPTHPLAGRRRVAWSELARQTWLISPVDSAARHRLDELCAEYQMPPPQCQVITRATAMTWAMLQRRSLITLVPASVFRQLVMAGQLMTLRMEHPMPFAPLGMLLPGRDVPAATQQLADHVQASSASPGGPPPSATRARRRRSESA